MAKKKLVQPAGQTQLRRIENTLRGLNQTLQTQQEEHRKALEEIKIDVTDIRAQLNRKRRKFPLFPSRRPREEKSAHSQPSYSPETSKTGRGVENNHSAPPTRRESESHRSVLPMDRVGESTKTEQMGKLLPDISSLQGIDLSKVMSLLQDPMVQSLLKNYMQNR